MTGQAGVGEGQCRSFWGPRRPCPRPNPFCILRRASYGGRYSDSARGEQIMKSEITGGGAGGDRRETKRD